MTESRLYEFIASTLNMNRTDVYASGIRMNGNNVAEARGVAADFTTGRRIEWHFDGETVTDLNSGKTYAEPTETETAEADETETNEQEGIEMKNAKFIATLNAILATAQNRSAWDRGVQEYAEEIAEEIAEGINGGYITIDDLRTRQSAETAMLDGAESWSEYSRGGSSLIYDPDIAKRLCTPSEYRKTRGGERRPNSREEWLDCQARALAQASRRVYASIRETFRQLDG